jgi:hypothetical protein
MNPQPSAAPEPRPDIRALDERHGAEPGHVLAVLVALTAVAVGEFAVFYDQVARASGEPGPMVVGLTVALILFVQLSMHLAAMCAVRRRGGLRSPGWVVEAFCVLAWAVLCGASFWLRVAVPAAADSSSTPSGQQVMVSAGPSAAAAGGDGTADLVIQTRFAWLCLALSLGAGVAAYVATTLLYRPRMRVLEAAAQGLEALEQQLAVAFTRQRAVDSALAAVAQHRESAAARRDERKARLRLVAEEAAERARLALVRQLSSPTDTTRVIRAPRVAAPAE